MPKQLSIHYPKLLFAAVLLIVFTTIAGFYLYNGILLSAEEIIRDNKNFTQTATAKLVLESERSLSPVWENHLMGKDRITKADERAADSLLSIGVQDVLNNFHRVEGGFYFYELDEFIGYGFPTITDPKPAFGPPPRSYDIIREQARTTIERDSLVTELHKFDPAIFPLTTQPIYKDDRVIGAAWARIHLERKLAATRSIRSGTFFLTVGAILLGLSVAVFIVWSLRKRMTEIKKGLHRMKHDPGYRLSETGGVLGVISRSINDMTDTRQKEQEKRKKLEHELYQKDKMAALGKLIAGTAHEINTPISIIKTRIQIWERKLQQLPPGEDAAFISDESLKMIHTEIDRVSGLIKKLLFFSRPVGKEKSAFDIRSVLEEKTRWLSEAYPDRNIRCSTDWDDTLPTVLADQESIEQVLANVLKNAVEASQTICKIEIGTRYLSNKNLIEIRVRDFGSGMPEHIKHKAFDPFFTTKQSGSGLGLSISHEIIRAHGGNICFEDPKKNHTPSQFRSDYTPDMVLSGTDLKTERAVGTVCIIHLPISF